VNAAQSLPIELFARDMQDGKKHKQIFVIRDLTEQKRSQARIEYLAHHDALTELPNRVQFNDRLQHDLACAARAQSSLAVLCLDMDRFKDVNDSMGHASGDELLKNVARRLAGIVRETDTVARLSGDEFAIVQVGCNQPDSAQRLATRIRDAMAEPFVLEGGATIVGMSIGVAVYPDDGDSAAILLRNADMALYRAKAEGRNTYRFFEPDMDKAMRERRELERDLRSSVENRELYLQYQPLAETQSGLVVGFEALVRWRHPVRGQLPPNDFIGIAEECGFITQLGQWVLREACREAARWTAPLRIAINLSPIQFQHGNLTQDVAAILAETGLAPERLELEITEGVLLADKANAIDTLTALKQLGVRIAMDDFGTGYSSLSYLQSFPFDKIKIDRSFVAGLQGNDDARAIVKAVIGLSHALNLPVVAEGVENDYQLELLRSELCTEVQGYLIGRPSDIDRFAELTGANRQLSA
jgi:diguanylate cyclase